MNQRDLPYLKWTEQWHGAFGQSYMGPYMGHVGQIQASLKIVPMQRQTMYRALHHLPLPENLAGTSH